MKLTLTTRACVGVICLYAGVAMGQTKIFRCGDSYSQVPCDNAHEVPLDAPRPPGAKAASDLTNARIAKEAQVLEANRLRQEALATHREDSTTQKKRSPKPAARDGRDDGNESTAPSHHKQPVKKPRAPAFFTAKSPAPEKAASPPLQ